MKNIFRVLGTGFCVLLSLFILIPSYAHANLTITPTRVIFEDGDRFSEVTLVNSSQETHTYEIKWQFFTMVEGAAAAYEPAEASITAFDLSQHMVYTPRRMTLAPGAVQKIRLALRRPAEVPPGEYRAHLTFSAVPDEEPEEGGGNEAMSVGVKVNVGFSIPVIFQAGEADVQANIDSMSLERNPNSGLLEAVIKVSRSGGSYGILGFLYVYNAKGDVLGEVSNANIFPEVNSRTFRVPLINEDLSGGAITVSIKHVEKEHQYTYTERSFPVNQ